MLPATRSQFESELASALRLVKQTLIRHNLPCGFELKVDHETHAAIQMTDMAFRESFGSEMRFAGVLVSRR